MEKSPNSKKPGINFLLKIRMHDRDCDLLTCHQYTSLECLGSFDWRMHVEHCRFCAKEKKHTTEFCPPSVYSKRRTYLDLPRLISLRSHSRTKYLVEPSTRHQAREVYNELFKLAKMWFAGAIGCSENHVNEKNLG